MIKECLTCNKLYHAEARYVNRGQGLTCSRECGMKLSSLKKTETRPDNNTTCSWCGLHFYKKPSSKRSKSEHYYCSREHQNMGRSANYHSSGPKKNKEKRSCLRCNMPYSGANDICQKCYKRCMVEEWLSGNNNITLNYSRTTGLPVDTKTFIKKYLIATRGDRCESCGFDQKAPNGRSIIQMDHVDGNCFNNNPTNLKLLCPNCHAMTPTYGSLNKGSGRAHRRKRGVDEN